MTSPVRSITVKLSDGMEYFATLIFVKQTEPPVRAIKYKLKAIFNIGRLRNHRPEWLDAHDWVVEP